MVSLDASSPAGNVDLLTGIKGGGGLGAARASSPRDLAAAGLAKWMRTTSATQTLGVSRAELQALERSRRAEARAFKRDVLVSPVFRVHQA
ncbi:hypothetical protein HDU67_009093 [Dinochytrium kinnereticum]|nr:hypothetical protein HDU67_009093 [Dinochytrium kinnereticum]